MTLLLGFFVNFASPFGYLGQGVLFLRVLCLTILSLPSKSYSVEGKYHTLTNEVLGRLL